MNDDIVIQRFLDHALNAAELTAFNQRLRDDAGLREHLREIAEQAVAMGDFARSEADVPARQQPPASARLSWLALAASIVVLAASAWFWMGRREAAVLTVVDSSGSVTWSHGGEMREGVANGETLPAGTLETIGETATALLRFADGTLISLTGESDLSFSEDGQKHLVLRKGSLSAQVRPQPKGSPMLVRTPTAEAEVVGTVFHLSTRSEDTLLKVDEGLVKLKRLADGSAIDVPAKSSALASLDSSLKLNSSTTPAALTAWSFDFTSTVPPRDWRGISRAGCMNATAYVARRNADGSVVTLYGVSVRTAMLQQPLRLRATESSIIRYRLRQDESGPLNAMLITHLPDGSFGGNFETQISENELQPGADGWCDVSLPITRFRLVATLARAAMKTRTAIGNIITSAIVNTPSASQRLAVARFELSSQQ